MLYTVLFKIHVFSSFRKKYTYLTAGLAKCDAKTPNKCILSTR